MASSSPTSRMTVGMSASPAICAARQRRSPAMISKCCTMLPFFSIGRATIGCTTPCALIELARSSSVSWRISTRGWYWPRCNNSSGICCSVSASCPVTAADCETGLLSNASSPRPSLFFFVIPESQLPGACSELFSSVVLPDVHPRGAAPRRQARGRPAHRVSFCRGTGPVDQSSAPLPDARFLVPQCEIPCHRSAL